MFVKRSAAFAILFILTVLGIYLFLPPDLPSGSSVAANDGIKESTVVWDRISSRYIKISPFEIDYRSIIIACIAGIVVVVSVNYYIRRLVDNVIKRQFTHTEDK